ncbi:MAG: bifunctional folylpolyglutamate synthase/dihydrofolate synthase [Bacteroidetes bacterium]|nr:bifunctional folylpolyglutamate synthase/dihydrofolate synthase [Bacteroidota bacterium]
MLNSYQAAIDWLFKQFPSYQNIGASAYKPGLERVEQLLTELGNPHQDLKIIHVAGTNGKGSTSSFMASYFTEKGEKVGLFTSPHIFDFRERIRVNGEKISEEFVLEFCNRMQDLDLQIEPSFFEITFAMAVCYFHSTSCSVCVLETGMGGRLDATNIVVPIVSVITNIGFDHTQFLGNTYSEIAFEKAGIIKKNTPVVIGETNSETKTVFLNTAKSQNAEIIFAEEEALPEISNLPLYQLKNLRTTIKALEICGFAIELIFLEKSLKNLHLNTGFFGRLTEISQNPRVILDVSHNLEGIKATLESIQPKLNGQLFILYGASADKNVEKIISQFPNDAIIHLCKFTNERSMCFEELKRLKTKDKRIDKVFENVNKAIAEIKLIMTGNDSLLVTGSFFLIADVEMN